MDAEVCIPQTLPVKDPPHKTQPWHDLRNVDRSGSYLVHFAALSDTKLPSVLLQLGAMPEPESHRILGVKYTFQGTLPKSINF